ncbi:helix-turn-helix transcriptional regulator [Anaeromusa sp.]|uniref:helix-turn-helix domain-containing protein n=1 Tax=Anaeromusa sp. TaxID=1872520 RepID=UPI002612BD47|nr:helix-turn-helix transcriptional regulator [Anaeromusa sp.]MDD3157480.1 helix-turn-helix transcriptional regulator [Anaeromusa sp.]
MTNHKTIAERLVELRGDEKRLVVASACGISKSALTMYELGARIPRDEIKVRLAAYYGTTVEEIFFKSQ